jgi:hypothetical protein
MKKPKSYSAIRAYYPCLIKAIQERFLFTEWEAVSCLYDFPSKGEELVEHVGGTRHVVQQAFRDRRYL